MKGKLWVVTFALVGLGLVGISRTSGFEHRHPARYLADQQAGVKEHEHAPPGSFVGKTNPELISTEVALGLVLRVIDGQAGSQGLQQYIAHIERMTAVTLSSDDRTVIVEAAKGYTTRTRVATPSEPTGIHPALFSSRQGGAARDMAELLQREMSPAGSAAFARFVEQAKRHITIAKF